MAKNLSDEAIKYPNAKLIVIGIAENVNQLIELDQSVKSRIKQIKIPRMKEEQLREIIISGAEQLGIEFAPFVVDQIVQLSDGFPKYTHLLALECSRIAIRQKSKIVTMEHFNRGLNIAIDQAQEDHKLMYAIATKSRAKSKRLHKKIVDSIALWPSSEITTEELARALKQYTGEDITTAQFAGPLGELKTEKRGRILKSVSGKFATHAFSNPMVKAYIRMKILAEQQETNAS
ncbi:hypothetical protein MOTE_24250 [Moorella thermoacetica]|uniref:Uncharacterized protein n=1 Tax=Neomoorella thermoacetica TaxID=1525 RepID=A0A1J5N995_NEOTH|nr:hypothetical protein MOTE_24250 [Moorella thermoacetica]